MIRTTPSHRRPRPYSPPNRSKALGDEPSQVTQNLVPGGNRAALVYIVLRQVHETRKNALEGEIKTPFYGLKTEFSVAKNFVPFGIMSRNRIIFRELQRAQLGADEKCSSRNRCKPLWQTKGLRGRAANV